MVKNDKQGHLMDRFYFNWYGILENVTGLLLALARCLLSENDTNKKEGGIEFVF